MNAQRIGSWLELSLAELRLAARTLWRAKAFSFAVIATLALCLGPNTAVFSALYSLLLKPLPFDSATRMYTIGNVNIGTGARYASSVAQWQDFRAHADLWDDFAIIEGGNSTLDGRDLPTLRVESHPVTANLFRLFGVQAVRGRLFTDEDGTAGRNNVAVVTEEFWRTRLEADPGVVGREIHLDSKPYTIIGVAPSSLDTLMRGAVFFVPIAPTAKDLLPDERYGFVGPIIGRLKAGVDLKAGQAQLDGLEARFRASGSTPKVRAFLQRGETRILLEPTQNFMLGAVANQIWMLQGGALLVLLIAGVNVMNLFLARATAKAPELAVRVALGAGRRMLVSHMIAEGLILVVTATAVGLGVGLGILAIFNWYLPSIAHTAPVVKLDPVAIGGVLVVALGLAVIVGVSPLWLIGRLDQPLSGSARTFGGRRGRILGGVLIVAQVAFAVTLLTGAGLLIRSYVNLTRVEPGFDAARVASGRVVMPPRYTTPASRLQLRARVMESMRGIPGVESVASSQYFTVAPVRAFSPVPFSLEGDANASGSNRPMTYLNLVSPGFFSTMGIRLLQGRGFTEADLMGPETVVIVDESFAQRYFPNRIVIGQRIAPGNQGPPPNGKWPTIVGVVARANFAGQTERDGIPFAFMPMNGVATNAFDIVVRSNRPFSDLVQDLRRELRGIDPEMPLYGESTLQQKLDSQLADRAGLTLLLGIFAGLAMLLAAVGLYGVLAYDVSQRTREIGVRSAIGASPSQIMTLILGQGAMRTSIGLIAGIAGALGLTRFLKSQLFDVPAIDPLSYSLVVIALSLVALLASWIPARRAAKIDPQVALRED